MKRKSNIKKIKCIICTKTFPVRTKRNLSGKSSAPGIRKKGSVTCSPKCSKIYGRILTRIRNLRKRIEKEEDVKKVESE